MAIQDIIDELASLELEPSPERLAELRDLLPIIDLTKQKVDKANRAGFDISNEKELLENAEKRIRNILRVYSG